MKTITIKYTDNVIEQIKKYNRLLKRRKNINKSINDYSKFKKELKIEFPELNLKIIVPIETLKYSLYLKENLDKNLLKNLISSDKRNKSLSTLLRIWQYDNLEEIIKKQIIKNIKIDKIKENFSKNFKLYKETIKNIDNKITKKFIIETLDIKNNSNKYRITKRRKENIQILEKAKKELLNFLINDLNYEKIDNNFLEEIFKNGYITGYKDLGIVSGKRKSPLFYSLDNIIQYYEQELLKLYKNPRKNKKEIEYNKSELEKYKNENKKLEEKYFKKLEEYFNNMNNLILKKENKVKHIFNGYPGGLNGPFMIEKLSVEYFPEDYYLNAEEPIKIPILTYENGEIIKYTETTYDIPKVWSITSNFDIELIFSNLLGKEFQDKYRKEIKNNKKLIKIIKELSNASKILEIMKEIENNTDYLKEKIKKEIKSILKNNKKLNQLKY